MGKVKYEKFCQKVKNFVGWRMDFDGTFWPTIKIEVFQGGQGNNIEIKYMN